MIARLYLHIFQYNVLKRWHKTALILLTECSYSTEQVPCFDATRRYNITTKQCSSWNPSWWTWIQSWQAQKQQCMNTFSLICTRSQTVKFPNFWSSAPKRRWSEIPLILINSVRKTSRLKTESNAASKNNFASFYGEECLVAVFTRHQHKSPSCARLIQ